MFEELFTRDESGEYAPGNFARNNENYYNGVDLSRDKKILFTKLVARRYKTLPACLNFRYDNILHDKDGEPFRVVYAFYGDSTISSASFAAIKIINNQVYALI
jgi:hypothetical protein